MISKKINWWRKLLSDTNEVSSKRFLGIQAFYLIVLICILTIIAVSKNPIVLPLLIQIEEHLFWIVMAAFFVNGSENIVKIIKSKNENYDAPKMEEQ